MPDHVEAHVGRRIRHCRWLLGMSQDELAGRLGLSPDEVQRAEAGEDPLPAARLAAIAQALRVPVAFLFEGLAGQAEDDTEKRAQILVEREAMELVRAYYALSPDHRKGLVDLARTLRNAGR